MSVFTVLLIVFQVGLFPLVVWSAQSKRPFSRALCVAAVGLWGSCLFTLRLSSQQEALDARAHDLAAMRDRAANFVAKWKHPEDPQPSQATGPSSVRVPMRTVHMDPVEFAERYEEKAPFITTNTTADWPAMHRWQIDEFGTTNHKSVRLSNSKQLGRFVRQLSVVANMYTRHDGPSTGRGARSVGSFSPRLNIIDKDVLDLYPALQADYSPPPYVGPAAPSANALPQLLRRMDRRGARYLIVSTAGGGASFHKDFWNTAFWNAQVVGSKRWVVIPPWVPLDAALLVKWHQMTALEWFERAYPQLLAGDVEHYSFNTHAGEVVYVPSASFHVTLNLEPSIAVSENILTPANHRIVFDTAVCNYAAPGGSGRKTGPGEAPGAGANSTYLYVEASYVVDEADARRACGALRADHPHLHRDSCCSRMR